MKLINFPGNARSNCGYPVIHFKFHIPDEGIIQLVFET